MKFGLKFDGTLHVFFHSSKVGSGGPAELEGPDGPCSVDVDTDGPPSFEGGGGEVVGVEGDGVISGGTFTYIMATNV